MSKLLIDARSGSGELVSGWSPLTLYGHDQLTLEPTREIVHKVAIAHSSKLPIILNIEPRVDGSWSLPGDQDKYMQVVDWFTEVRPDLRKGFYSIVPPGDYWAGILDFYGIKSGMQEWGKAQSFLSRGRNAHGQFVHRGLLDVVDFVCPALYMPYIGYGPIVDHDEMWFKAYAPATLNAAKNCQKQVYPFICPRVHEGNTLGHALQYVGDDLLRQQIKYCIDNTDGCIIWDYYLWPNASEILKQTSIVMKEFK
jgi:hypothetical protein